MTRVLVLGARGRVGSLVVAGVKAAEDLELCAEVDLGDDLAAAIETGRPDVAIDFTTPDAVFENTRTLLTRKVHAVIGTSGLTPAQLDELGGLAKANGVAVLFAPNFAVGAVLMMRFAEEAARHFPWVEIIERHHEHKIDAPSGTATVTAQRLAAARSEAVAPANETETAPGARGGRVDDIPVHSIRLPGSVAHQEVLFGGPGETLSIRHDTIDRAVFVPGVLLGVRGVKARTGLLLGLETVLWPDS